MQKQTITIEFFLALQSTDSHIEIGIFNKNHCLASSAITKKDASKTFLIVLDELLNKTNLQCKSLNACLVNRGPSPFTLLRTVIAYTHGLQAALKIPIAGIEGFHALSAQHGQKEHDTLILQNAFGNQLYYYHANCKTKEIKDGCTHYSQLEETLNLTPNAPLIVLGNGYELYKEQLTHLKKQSITINHDPTTHFPSINFLGSWGYEQIINGSAELTDQPLMPLYLKNPDFFSK
jgi:tRNA threonylcarbamoyl adenosine modification protein YeaZ